MKRILAQVAPQGNHIRHLPSVEVRVNAFARRSPNARHMRHGSLRGTVSGDVLHHRRHETEKSPTPWAIRHGHSVYYPCHDIGIRLGRRPTTRGANVDLIAAGSEACGNLMGEPNRPAKLPGWHMKRRNVKDVKSVRCLTSAHSRDTVLIGELIYRRPLVSSWNAPCCPETRDTRLPKESSGLGPVAGSFGLSNGYPGGGTTS
jgi:hypothetical protein